MAPDPTEVLFARGRPPGGFEPWWARSISLGEAKHGEFLQETHVKTSGSHVDFDQRKD